LIFTFPENGDNIFYKCLISPLAYILNFSNATGRLINAKDHASVQINVADVDANGVFTGATQMYALCGFVRASAESDDALNRLTTEDGYLKK
jgi:small subunit ribosomal protein S21e